MAKRNVGNAECLVSGLGGSLLTIWGLRRASLPGLGAAVAGAALAWRAIRRWRGLDAAPGLDRASDGTTVGNLGVKIDRSVVVAATPERLYRFWRNLENLPRIMSHLDRVEMLGPMRSRWHAKAPAGVPLSWEADIINDEPNALIAWRTVPGAVVAHAGSVRFIPEGAGTRVDVSLQYDPPGGVLAHEIAALIDGDAGARIARDLATFKTALESGRLAA
jgi:uncharacterized membrane protein